MEILPFGQPLGAIMQVGYIVPDMAEAIEHWTTRLNVGPFFVFEHFPLLDVEYRGRKTEFDVDLALAYSGSMCIELIVQNNSVPSVYSEIVEARGYGFHHLAVSTRDFEGDIKRHQAQGVELALYGVAEVGARAAYMDTLAATGGMTELIEITPPVEGLFSAVQRASAGWQGEKPVRGVDDL